MRTLVFTGIARHLGLISIHVNVKVLLKFWIVLLFLFMFAM